MDVWMGGSNVPSPCPMNTEMYCDVPTIASSTPSPSISATWIAVDQSSTGVVGRPGSNGVQLGGWNCTEPITMSVPTVPVTIFISAVVDDSVARTLPSLSVVPLVGASRLPLPDTDNETGRDG